MKFHKALTGARELLRADKLDRLNSALLLKICDVFLKNYLATSNIPYDQFEMNKKQLYKFFDEYTAKVAKDY